MKESIVTGPKLGIFADTCSYAFSIHVKFLHIQDTIIKILIIDKGIWL